MKPSSFSAAERIIGEKERTFSSNWLELFASGARA